MISVTTGDILKSKKHALVNTVNCVGIMGKGVALGFKRRYPEMFREYAELCMNKQVKLGEPYPYYADDGHVIVNFPTKNHWRAVSRLSDIVAGLRFLQDHYREWGLKSIAVPPLGCGNGQLEWRVVGPTLHRELAKLDIPVELFAPLGTPLEQMQLEFFGEREESTPALSTYVEPSWVALIETVRRIENHQHHWPVGRVRFQKVAYFLTSLGVPMGLEYERGSYGPYSPQLKPVISKLVNNGLLQETRRGNGNMISMEVGPTFADAQDAYAADLRKWDQSLDRVTDLFVRMTTDQSEVAATVHFVAKELGDRLGHRPTELDVVDEVLQWKERRPRPFDRQTVLIAVRNLAMLHWIEVEPSHEFVDEEEALSHC